MSLREETERYWRSQGYVKYEFTPQDDITAHELAEILRQMHVFHETWVNSKDWSADNVLQRHFTRVEEDDD